MRLLLLMLVAVVASAQRPTIVRDVRVALNAGDFSRASQLLDAARQKDGVTSHYLEALSWMGRAKLAAKEYAEAQKYAGETYKLAQELLKQRRLDADTALPLAVGAAIEVQSLSMNAMGQKTEAVVYLRDEMDKFHGSTIITRLRKNLHLISLEGKNSPVLDVSSYLGEAPQPLARLRGKPVVLFFWAHWCGDCKSMAPALSRLAKEYAGRVAFIGPTQYYGYVAGGQEAGREQEKTYIDQVRRQHYAAVDGLTVPLSQDNFVTWGASTTPTLALIDRQGMVRLYHPGRMTYEELQPKIEALLGR